MYVMNRETARTFISDFRLEADYDIAGDVYKFLEDSLLFAWACVGTDVREFGKEVFDNLLAHNYPDADEAKALLLWAFEYGVTVSEPVDNAESLAELLADDLLYSFGRFVGTVLMNAE